MKIANVIGKAVWDQRGDIRDVISIGKLVRKNDGPEEVEQIVSTMTKYGNYASRCSVPFTKYDYVLDCTGVHRSLLPKSAHDLILPTYEFLVECVDNMEDFFIMNYENSKGYFWYFPLDKKRAYMGAGDMDKKYYGIELFFRDHPEAKVIRKIGRPIRLSPPTRMEPFYNGNIIGVGESIGCVFPATGEGIAPTLHCCDIFLEVFDKNEQKFDLLEYRRKLVDAFGFYDDVYKILRMVVNNQLNSLFLNTIGDLKTLLVNESGRAGTIRNIAKYIKVISLIIDISKSLEYPVLSFADFFRKLNKEPSYHFQDLFLKQMIIETPAHYFPMMSYEDLIDKFVDWFIIISQTSMNN